jgi:prepilin-type N-terminal cleavage/methylation domain-containing protein
MAFPKMTRGGFTLVEIVASLLLVGVLASVAGMFIVTGMQGYETAVTASEGALKAQVAIKRMTAELSGIDPDQAITLVSNSSIGYQHTTLSPGLNRSISYSSTQNRINLTVDGSAYPLIDGIEAFSLSSQTSDLDGDGNDEIAQVDLTFTLEDIGSFFQIRVFPRNLLPNP